jgi:NADH pyrophosphatase NudC (nudix superfamily)
MQYVSGDIADHDDEVAEVRWVSIEYALKQLTYQLDKDNLEKAQKVIV